MFFDIAIPLFVTLLLVVVGMLALSGITNSLLESDITALIVIPVCLAVLVLVLTGLYFYIPTTALVP